MQLRTKLWKPVRLPAPSLRVALPGLLTRSRLLVLVLLLIKIAAAETVALLILLQPLLSGGHPDTHRHCSYRVIPTATI